MKHRSLLSLLALLMILGVVGPRVQAAVNIPLTIQEAIYPGALGLARTLDPVSVGIPLPDDPVTGATEVSQLTLTGTSVGQFRVLGRWPSGRIKWVLVDTLASVAAGGEATGIALTTGGNGNFGGSDLAIDNGAAITVTTGTATFTIRKANFNGFHQVVVGGTTVVAAGASNGLVITGPAPGNTTCGTCTTVYSSVNDASSTAEIEENGPVRTVIKATGTHKDASGNPYLRFTVRMHFYKSRSHVKAVTTLQNADYGGSNTFASAYKGHQGYEWRVSPTLTGTPTYQIAKHGGTVESGTLAAGTDDVHLYQAKSLSMEDTSWCAFGCVPYTTDTGYTVVKNGVSLATGTTSQYPQGWADIRGAANGAGLSIGVYQLAAYWPKSLEFNDGGTDVRIGIWPRQNSQPYYQAWPQWSTHDLYFNFHSAALSSASSEFLKVQHRLLGRATLSHYNATAVFPFPIVDPAVEDAFFASTHATANPTNTFPFETPSDAGLTSGAFGEALRIYRFKTWQAGGGSNQTEFRWSWLHNFIQRGFTGRYLNAAHFYRFQTDDTFPHSDGFNWRDRPNETEFFGRPQVASTNAARAHIVWIDQEHGHWYGMTDYYFMSGDELVKDTLLDGMADWFLDDTSYQAGDAGGLFNTRATGIHLMGAARYATFLSAIGGQTANAAQVLTNATDLFNLQVKGVLCTQAEVASQGCTVAGAQGVSRTRGVQWGQDGSVGNWCGAPVSYWRFHSTWQSSMLQQGILEFRQAKGSGWADYLTALDLAYGMALGATSEGYVGNSGLWNADGFRHGLVLDNPQNCPTPPPDVDQNYTVAAAIQSHWFNLYTQYLVEGATPWSNKMRISLLKLVNYTGVNTEEFNTHGSGLVISAINAPGAVTLNTVPITSVVDNGGGSYTVSWTVPANAQSYRIKWGAKQIVELIGFNPLTNTFTGNPTTTMNWWAAANVPTLPTPAAAGTTQSLTITTGRSGLTGGNFSVKAYVAGAGTGTGTVLAPPVTLALVSGNNQAGTAGSSLSTPFIVKVSNANGNPVAGVNVTFAVTGGGGTVSNAVAVTGGSGLASTTLTLGSAAGINTVTATSGTLAGSPVTFTAVASTAGEGQRISLFPNRWVNVSPTYQGAPNGGQLTPMTFNNMGVYDPVSKRTISFDRWYDPIRSMSIYANALVAYDPADNTATVLKLTNWLGSNPFAANTADPTPIDRHPLGGLALDPNGGAVYLVNGANQTGRAFYPDHPNDTWKFGLGSRSWSRVSDPIGDSSTVHPPSDVGTYSGMVHDLPTGRLAYFITEYNGSGTTTWLFDTSLNRWSAVKADPSAANVRISIAGIAYDSQRSLVLAYGGGYSSVSPPSTKLWAYSVGQNKWTALADAPIAAAAPEFAYDSVNDVFLALVGRATLIYNPRTNAWSYLAATIDRGTNLNRQNVTYNAAQDVFVFQGGTWDRPVWSLFRYTSDAPTIPIPRAPTNLRIVR